MLRPMRRRGHQAPPWRRQAFSRKSVESWQGGETSSRKHPQPAKGKPEKKRVGTAMSILSKHNPRLRMLPVPEGSAAGLDDDPCCRSHHLARFRAEEILHRFAARDHL